MADDPQVAMMRAVAAREGGLTPEQRARREVVARHTAIISAGVKPPKSGIFGRPVSAKS